MEFGASTPLAIMSIILKILRGLEIFRSFMKLRFLGILGNQLLKPSVLLMLQKVAFIVVLLTYLLKNSKKVASGKRGYAP